MFDLSRVAAAFCFRVLLGNQPAPGFESRRIIVVAAAPGPLSIISPSFVKCYIFSPKRY